MGGSSGGGGSTIQPLPWPQQQKDIGKGYKFQGKKFYNFWENDPLLSAARQGAQDFWGQLPGMLDQFGGFQSQLSDYQKQLGGISGQLGNLYGTAQNQIGAQQKSLGNLYGNVGGLASRFNQYLAPQGALQTALSQTINPVLRSGGALTGAGKRNANQEILQSMSRAGTAGTNASIFNQALNREEYKDRRFNQALAQSQGILGQQAGAAGTLQNIYGQQAGITGQRAGLTGLLSQIGQGIFGQQAGITSLGAGLTGQQAGLLGQKQALQSGALNQMLGVGNAAVGQFTGLMNPILAAVSGNYQAQNAANIANAQIAAQQQAAGDSKTAGLIGGGASAIGGIALAAL